MKKLLTCLALAAFLAAVGCDETKPSTKKAAGGSTPPTPAKKEEPKKEEPKKEEPKKEEPKKTEPKKEEPKKDSDKPKADAPKKP